MDPSARRLHQSFGNADHLKLGRGGRISPSILVTSNLNTNQSAFSNANSNIRKLSKSFGRGDKHGKGFEISSRPLSLVNSNSIHGLSGSHNSNVIHGGVDLNSENTTDLVSSRPSMRPPTPPLMNPLMATLSAVSSVASSSSNSGEYRKAEIK